MRKAAMNVKVFQWPCGTLATSRSPRGERPEWRTILVVTDVSSIKTRRLARKDDCSAFSSARAAATSGRSCSAACSVFFEGDAVSIVKSPDRGSTDLQLFGRCEARPDLVECQIGFSGHQIEQPPLVLLERRAAVASAGLRRDATGCPPEFHPADGRRGAKIESDLQQLGNPLWVETDSDQPESALGLLRWLLMRPRGWRNDKPRHSDLPCHPFLRTSSDSAHRVAFIEGNRVKAKR